jgi:hypothetical protein
MREVSVDELYRAAGAELEARVTEILDHEEWGCALFKSAGGISGVGGARFVASYGDRFAELAGRLPPSHVGDAVLDCHVPPEPMQQKRVSPVKAALASPYRERVITQASRGTAPPVTVFPEFPRGR